MLHIHKLFIRLSVLLILVPLISARALIRRDFASNTAAKLNIIDQTLRGYLENYKGPNENQLKLQSNFAPEYNMQWDSDLAITRVKTIHDQFPDLQATLSQEQQGSVSTFKSNSWGLFPAMHIFENLDNTQQFKVIIASLDWDKAGYVFVLAATHGFWVLPVDSAFAKTTLENFKTWFAAHNMRGDMKLSSTDFFKEEIDNQYLSSTHPESLLAFVMKIQILRGKATGLWLVARSESSKYTSDAPIAKRLFTAFKDRIQYVAKSIIDGELNTFSTVWNPKKLPWDNVDQYPQLNDFSLAFFYSQIYEKWEMVSLFGSQLGLFTLTGRDGIPATNPPPIMHRLAWKSVESVRSEFKFTNPISHHKLGLGVIVLTSRGYWLVMYTPAALSVAPTSTTSEGHLPGWHEVMADLQDAMQNELQGATGHGIIVLTPTDNQGYVIWGSQLDDLYSSVKEQTKSLFSGQAATTPYLIPAVPRRPSERVGKRRLLLTAKRVIGTSTGEESIDFQVNYGGKKWLHVEENSGGLWQVSISLLTIAAGKPLSTANFPNLGN